MVGGGNAILATATCTRLFEEVVVTTELDRVSQELLALGTQLPNKVKSENNSYNPRMIMYEPNAKTYLYKLWIA